MYNEKPQVNTTLIIGLTTTLLILSVMLLFMCISIGETLPLFPELFGTVKCLLIGGVLSAVAGTTVLIYGLVQAFRA